MEHATEQKAASISGTIERKVAPEPVNSTIRSVLLAAAGASMLASLCMQLANRKHESLFVGQWAPTFVAIALWYQIVKEGERPGGRRRERPAR